MKVSVCFINLVQSVFQYSSSNTKVMEPVLFYSGKMCDVQSADK